MHRSQWISTIHVSLILVSQIDMVLKYTYVYMYVDDTQLLIPFSIEEYDSAIAKHDTCIAEMQTWHADNHLKLHDETK